VRTTRSSKRVAREFQAVDGIPKAELGEHDAFHIGCCGGLAVDAAVAVVPRVPSWFGLAMASVLEPVQGSLNTIEARMKNIEARQINSVASDPTDPLRGLSNLAGIAFASFPNTLFALDDMNEVQMTASLNQYGLSDEEIEEEKLHTIKKFIGMRIA
jgi:hypothetical protein